ncbi:MAG: hypothetical protein K0S33_1914 [Bacteroidetes bacterium]|jgi:hypothetical protein|nr:hypothetical protein [Bacteroidota bacterium]
MKKTAVLLILSLFTLVMEAQTSKLEVQTMLTGLSMKDMQDIFLIRTRKHDGATQGWFEKYEKLDPKTCKITYNDNSMFMEGTSYSTLIPYDKIKLIFVKKNEYISIELID